MTGIKRSMFAILGCAAGLAMATGLSAPASAQGIYVGAAGIGIGIDTGYGPGYGPRYRGYRGYDAYGYDAYGYAPRVGSRVAPLVQTPYRNSYAYNSNTGRVYHECVIDEGYGRVSACSSLR